MHQGSDGKPSKYNRFDVAAARSYGHTVCSHSHTHVDLRTLPDIQAVKQEMLLTQSDGKQLITDCARPPYGAKNAMVEAAFKQLGYSLDMWTLDTDDWRGKTQQQIIDHVVANAQPGDVVLMHMNHKGFNSETLAAIQQGLQARGIAVH